MWRFRELLNFCPDKHKVTIGEGQTILQQNRAIAEHLGMKPDGLFLQYEGLNPSGSFKDNGMAAAFSHAMMVGAKSCACASTGNTSASVALYAHSCGLKCTVFIGSGRIAFGKLSQAMDYGAQTIQIQGDFDDCMRQVQAVCIGAGPVPAQFAQSLPARRPKDDHVPHHRGPRLGRARLDRRARRQPRQLQRLRQGVPGAQAARPDRPRPAHGDHQRHRRRHPHRSGQQQEAHLERRPRQSEDHRRLLCRPDGPAFLAAHLRLGHRNLPAGQSEEVPAARSTSATASSGRSPTRKSCDAKALIGKYGLGCEPASAATIAGLKHLLAEGVIAKDERVACVLTGHTLKDPNATVNYHKEKQGPFSNPPVEAPNDLQAIIKLIR